MGAFLRRSIGDTVVYVKEILAIIFTDLVRGQAVGRSGVAVSQ